MAYIVPLVIPMAHHQINQSEVRPTGFVGIVLGTKPVVAHVKGTRDHAG
jgi:hypothetical protein